MTDPKNQANLLPVGKNPVLGLAPLVFITNLGSAAAAAAAAKRKTRGAMRISGVTMARLVLLPCMSVFKNRKQGQDAVPICNQLGSQSKQGFSEHPGQGKQERETAGSDPLLTHVPGPQYPVDRTRAH